jgi:hypothetical protein
VRSGLPSHFSKQSDMYRLERREASQWVSVALPDDRVVDWRREKNLLCYNCSRLGLLFGTKDLKKGEYRVVQKGEWQPPVGSLKPYETVSRSFEIR